MKSLMQISLTHTLVYFDFSMVQILHNDPVIIGYTDIVLRLKGIIAEQILYVTDLEGWKTIISKMLFRKSFKDNKTYNGKGNFWHCIVISFYFGSDAETYHHIKLTVFHTPKDI